MTGDRGQISIDVKGLLDHSLLTTEVAIENALGVLGSHLDNLTVNGESVFKDLLSEAHVLEFVLSSLNDHIYQNLQQWIIESFPANAGEYPSSVSSSLLARLSLSILFVPYSWTADEAEDFRTSLRTVEQAPAVLAILSTARFSDEPDDFPDFSVKKQSQRERKQRRRRNTILESKPFDMLRFDVPTNTVEAKALEKVILVELESILQYYLSVLRRPALKDILRTMYIPLQGQPGDKSQMNTNTSVELLVEEEADPESLPVAYPMVQPMKAALYFDSADGFGDWRVLISTRADTDLRQARKREFKLFEIIVKKIKELSMGHFSDDNQKRLTGPETDIPIYEAKMTRDSRLIYQIDCVAEFESQIERQVIKIFGIYTHAQLDRRFWDGVGYQLGRKGKEYKSRCTFRNKPHVSGGKVFMPASWPAPAESGSDGTAWSSGIPDLHKDDLAKMHELLVLEKYVTFSQALLNSVLADKDVQHVFDISTQEMRIIEHPASCYVIGRSGTGKTTTMMFKMLGIERSAQAFGNALSKPRQLFVTQSRVLAEKVEQFFTKLLGALNTANLSTDELRTLEAMKHIQQDQGLVDLDEEFALRSDLPKRFSELSDEHFPMFATFSQLCTLLEADLGAYDKQSTGGTGTGALEQVTDGSVTSTDYMQQRRSAFVSFGVFQESYWPHFPQSLTKGLDPTLVYGEFMGVIKGSEQTLECKSQAGCLDKNSYINYSHRQQATFSGKRETIYSLFEIYAKRKRERKEYDAADRSHAILERLRDGDLPGRQVDFIYVDEAQDNLLIDALILRTLCKNPESGLFWAGDTAQTISIGSSFRFNDLKAFLYRIETVGNPLETTPVQQPASFQLAVNYRSHGGIVNCAHSIIELITRFWPHAIDSLAPERGVIDGLKPVFFTGWDDDTERYEQFLFGESGNQIEFGAEQCILVRDDGARERLRAQVGDIGIIMTLYESKGLEFNDVLLYNFFEDSTVDASQWRVVLNALENSVDVKPPRFDEVRHGSVCRELKFLYVASTRARMNLWLADGSDKAEPMRLLWTARDLIKNCTPGTDVPRLAVSSTPEQWAATAKALFERKRYAQAMHCYERASLPREKAASYAYLLRERAYSASQRNADPQANAFAAAADAFWLSAEQAVTEKLTYYRISAECYRDSGDDSKTAKAYERACKFDLAAQFYRKAGMFDEAVAVVKSYGNTMDENLVQGLKDVAKLFYLRDHKIRQARDLFDSDDEALEYMDDYGFDMSRASFLEELNRLAEAAEIHLEEGRTLEAIELFSKDKNNADSISRASQCLLDGLSSHLSFGIRPNPDRSTWTDTLRELVRLLNKLEIVKLDGRAQDQVLMFRAIVAGDCVALTVIGERLYHTHRDIAAALLCLEYAFSAPPDLKSASAVQVTKILQSFLVFARILQNLSADPNPCSSEIIQRLFGFESASEESFLIPKDTYLYQRADRGSSSCQSTDRGVILLRWDLERLIRRVLRTILSEQVRTENNICRSARALQPCLPFVVFNRCNRQHAGCPQDHLDSESLNAQGYNSRIRMSVQQILIYHTLFATENYREQVRQRWYWIRQFYDALYPAFYKLGSIHSLSTQLIPELEEGIHVLNAWTREQLVSLKPETDEKISKRFMTHFVRAASLSHHFDADFAHHELKTIRAVTAYRPEHLLRNKDTEYIVHDILGFMQDDESYSLSRGVLFIRHVLENRLPIDAGVLCDVLDRLCGLLIASNRNFKVKTPTLHEITLPHSWLVHLSQDFDRLPQRDTNLIFLYVRPMADLLKQIYDGDSEHLLFESKNLAYLGWSHSNIFIHRICRNLCLLGYNLRNDKLRTSILKCVTSIRKPGESYNALYAGYVEARLWDDLAQVVRRSIGTPVDELIQVRDAKKTLRAVQPPPNVRCIVYQKLEDIPELLKSGGNLNSSLPSTAVPKGQVTANGTPKNATVQASRVLSTQDGDAATESPHEHEDVEEETVEDVVGQVLDDTTPITIENPRITSAESTQEELGAALVILAAYREYLRRRAFVMSRVRGMRVRLHAACFSASRTIEWTPRSLYRMLFLGVVPHLLVCLECTREYLHAAKKEAKKRVQTVVHSELEKVDAEITTLSASFKSVIQLEKELWAQSELHPRRDVKQLTDCATRVERLVLALPPDAALEWEDDLRLAMQGIVQANAPPPMQQQQEKQLKPQLNTEDLLEY